MRYAVAAGVLTLAWYGRPPPAAGPVAGQSVVARGVAPVESVGAGDGVIRLRFAKDRTPWEVYAANPAAADLRFRGRTVEFVMPATARATPGGYALDEVVNGRPLHTVLLRPGQEGTAAGLGTGQLVRVRGRVDRLDGFDRRQRDLRVVLTDGEVVHARLRWDAGADDYLPDD